MSEGQSPWVSSACKVAVRATGVMVSVILVTAALAKLCEFFDRAEWCRLQAEGWMALAQRWWCVGAGLGVVALGCWWLVWGRIWGVRPWQYVRWGPRGLISWVRWRRLDADLRSKLQRLDPHAWELVVSTVRTGKPWQGGRLSVEMGEATGVVRSRLLGQLVWYSTAIMADTLYQLQEAGVLTFAAHGTAAFLVKLSATYGSPDRLAEMLEMKLVVTRRWRP